MRSALGMISMRAMLPVSLMTPVGMKASGGSAAVRHSARAKPKDAASASAATKRK